jgi:hypothetical protein
MRRFCSIAAELPARIFRQDNTALRHCPGHPAGLLRTHEPGIIVLKTSYHV